MPPGRAERGGRRRLGRGVPAADGRRAGAEYFTFAFHINLLYSCNVLCTALVPVLALHSRTYTLVRVRDAHRIVERRVFHQPRNVNLRIFDPRDVIDEFTIDRI